jgi:hypothetical protein
LEGVLNVSYRAIKDFANAVEREVKNQEVSIIHGKPAKTGSTESASGASSKLAGVRSRVGCGERELTPRDMHESALG